MTPDRSEVNFFGGQLMSAKNLSHSLAQGTAVLRQRSKWLQGDIKAELDEILKSSEFRCLILEIDQMRYLFNKGPKFTYRVLSCIFGRSKSHIHTLLTAKEPVEEIDVGGKKVLLEKRCGPSLLTDEEENMLKTWIGEQQVQGNCPTPAEVRNQASLLYEKRTGEYRDFDRSWWKRFKLRHSEVITQWVHAIEALRADVTQQSVELYFSQVLDALMHIKSARQLVNLDEVGLCQRPDKGRRRRVVSLKEVSRKPSFREDNDGSHVTLTAAVNLAGEALKPHFLGMSELRCKDRDLWLLSDKFSYERTAKGRQTLLSFTNYARSILSDYVKKVREELGDENAKVYLIMDNATVHAIPDVLREVGIQPIWLPPHSSHFLQVLDLLVFAELKKAYRTRRAKKTSPKLEGKLLRSLYAWNVATHHLTILKAWQRAGIVPMRESLGQRNGAERFTIDIRRVHAAIQRNCPDADQDVEQPWLLVSS